MNEIDLDKLTDEQKKALAQVEASLAGNKVHEVSKKSRLLKYVALAAMFIIVMAAMVMLFVAMGAA